TQVSSLAEVGDDCELFVRSFDGAGVETGKEEPLTHGTGAWILDHAWSPDSKKIAFTDKLNRLTLVDVASKAVSQVDRSAEDNISGVQWSADSGWLTYSKTSPNGFDAVWIASASDKPTPKRVTTDHYDHDSPTFDPEGRYLFFTSARDFELDRLRFRRRLYALPLRKDVASPLAPESDEESGAKKKGAAAEAKPAAAQPAETKT